MAICFTFDSASETSINDVVSISHVAHDYHCSCSESKEMQLLRCACRT